MRKYNLNECNICKRLSRQYNCGITPLSDALRAGLLLASTERIDYTQFSINVLAVQLLKTYFSHINSHKTCNTCDIKLAKSLQPTLNCFCTNNKLTFLSQSCDLFMTLDELLKTKSIQVASIHRKDTCIAILDISEEDQKFTLQALLDQVSRR